MSEGDLAGVILFDRYQLESIIGAGGMGEVYAATDTKQGREGRAVAVKMLYAKYGEDQGYRDRFKRESKMCVEVLKPLKSPYIARPIDAGVTQGRYWIAFERLPGESLGAVLKRHRTVDLNTAAWIVRDMLCALRDAHHAGLIHRDLKPENLFVESYEVPIHVLKETRVRLLDFGVSRYTAADAAASGLTSLCGEIIGTAVYMSPEQLTSPRSVDVRTDIYSAGLIAYRLLTGQQPYEGWDIPEIAGMKLADGASLMSLGRATGLTWAEPMDRWIMRATARFREDRFSSAAEALDEWLAAIAASAEHVQEVFETRSPENVSTEIDPNPRKGA